MCSSDLGFEDLDVTDLHPKKLIKRTIGLDESTFSLDKPEKQEEPKRKAQIDPDLL